jgi:hypothetical protein
MRSDNKVRELATVCLPWQQWTQTLARFDEVGISAFHSCIVVIYGSLFLSDVCYCLSVFGYAVVRMSELELQQRTNIKFLVKLCKRVEAKSERCWCKIMGTML